MKITVILCTYNRCDVLPQALASIAACTMPESIAWEILVVDNNSNDQTRQVVEDFSRRQPGRFRYLLEPHPGKSYALNTAIRESLGDILAFVDDDVTVEPTWLQNLTAELHDDRWAGAGGRIRPQDGFSAPPWLSTPGPRSPYQDAIDHHSVGPIVLFNLGDKAGELDRPPYGTNMAFRRVMFEKYGGFRIDLGPRPGSGIRNEETEFSLRLMAAGERLWYAPSAVICHPVSKQRLTKKYLRAWWFTYGQAVIQQGGERFAVRDIPKHYHIRLTRLTRWMFDANPHWPLYAQWRFYWESQILIAAGEITETLRLSRHKTAKNSDIPQRNLVNGETLIGNAGKTVRASDPTSDIG